MTTHYRMLHIYSKEKGEPSYVRKGGGIITSDKTKARTWKTEAAAKKALKEYASAGYELEPFDPETGLTDWCVIGLHTNEDQIVADGVKAATAMEAIEKVFIMRARHATTGQDLDDETPVKDYDDSSNDYKPIVAFPGNVHPQAVWGDDAGDAISAALNKLGAYNIRTQRD